MSKKPNERKRKLFNLDETDLKGIKKICASNREQPVINQKLSFQALPTEIKVVIFKYLSFKDLSNVSIVSKPLRDIIINHFLLSKESLLNAFKLIGENGETDDYLKISTEFGLLIKRATFIYSNFRRIDTIIKMFEIVDVRGQLRAAYETDKLAFKNFSKAIKSVISKLISGWKFKEVVKLIDAIEVYFNNGRLIQLLLTMEFGIVKKDEQYLRFFYRKIIFESFEDNSSRAKWLMHFLNYHSRITSDENIKTSFHARLLILLFAPIFQDDDSDLVYIDWFGFSNIVFLRDGLEYLGFALKLLDSLKASNRPNICSLFIAITNHAIYWLFENSATLLFHSGFNVATQIIDFTIKKENYNHLVRYLANLFIVESKLASIGKIDLTDRMANEIYSHLKKNLNKTQFESIMNLIGSEFLNISKEIENAADDREYLEISELILGMLQFFELRLKKKHLAISNENQENILPI